MSLPFRRLPLVLTVIACALLGVASTAQALTLVKDGGSSHRIYLADDAPSSVQQAARELAHCIKLATGVDVSIVRSKEIPDGPVISLGDNAAARKAGLSLQGIALEGYRIAVRQGSVYILGPDTANKQFTPQGGVSNGTRNGVYTFLENQLEVRFLFPGDIGLDVPSRNGWEVPDDLDLTEQPGFLSRRLPYIQNQMPAVRQWSDRLKLGRSLELSHGHNWAHTVPAKLYDQHPDWFAMQAGQRVAPAGRYKLETTNPQLVAFYAQAAIDALEKSHAYSYSLSPSDSAGWSTSPQSLALTEKDPQGNVSITPLILDFYRHVALQVKAKLPHKAVAGYIYAAYLYPPAKKTTTLPDNLHLVLAPSIDYGYTLFRPEVQAQFISLFNAWHKITPNLAYYDLPNFLSQKMGLIPAPGLDILQFIFPKLQEAKVTSVYIYGQGSWGNGALSNYVMAKMMWNPQADAHALAKDFLLRAYGPKAGPYMEQIYTLLDQAVAAHFRADADASYTVTPALLKDIYGRNWPQIESLYLKAKAAAPETTYQRRLAMFKKNLLVMRWNLVYQRVIPADSASPLARDNQAMEALLSQANDDLALGENVAIEKDKPVKVDAVRVRVAPAAKPGSKPTPYLLRGPSRTLIYPQADVDVTIKATLLSTRGETLRYTVADSIGKILASGILTTDPIRFFGHENQPYFLDVQARSASYQLQVDGASWAIRVGGAADHENNGLHLLQKTTSLYFTPLADAANFTLTLQSSAPGETASIEILNPAGQSAAKLQTVTAPTDRQTIDTHGHKGTWSLVFHKPTGGAVDDVFIRFDAGISPWVSLDGQHPLAVEMIP